MLGFTNQIWNLARHPFGNNKHPLGRPPRRTRLFVEVLEDRSVPAGTAQGIIEGTAFIDANRDGAFDASEAILEGAEVRLQGTTNNLQAIDRVATSDANGNFRFDNMRPGQYTVNGQPVAPFSPSSSTLLNVVLGEGQTVRGTIGYSGLGPDSITLRQFLNSTTDEVFDFTDPGTGELFVDPNTENRPILAGPLTTQVVGKNVVSAIELTTLFTDPDITNSLVQFQTTQGNINVELFDIGAPATVNNFFNYVLDNDYDNSIFQRLLRNFVIQGGGFTLNTDPTTLDPIAKDPAVQNEFGESNEFGTIAMAKVENDPNSATNEFFFNLSNNSANLDNQNGGFTVFGQTDDAGIGVLNVMNTLQPVDQGAPFDNIPLIDFNGANFPADAEAENFVILNDVQVLRRDEFLTFELLGNSNPALVNATILNQNRLIITPTAGAEGTALITVRATDTFGASLVATIRVSVENLPPRANVVLDTDEPAVDSTLTATVVANDPNGDAVTLTYVWKVNDVVQRTETTANLTDALDLTGIAVAGDTVTVEVTPNDGELNGTTVTAEATVAGMV